MKYDRINEIENPLSYFTKLSQPSVHTPEQQCQNPPHRATSLPGNNPSVLLLRSADPRLVNWAYVSTLNLSAYEYDAYASNLDWKTVSRHIPFETALRFRYLIDWDLLVSSTRVSYRDLVAHNITVRWATLIKHQSVPEHIISANLDAIERDDPRCWVALTQFQKLSEIFISTHADRVDWDNVVFFQDVSFEFLCKHVDRLNLVDDLMLNVSDTEYATLVTLQGRK